MLTVKCWQSNADIPMVTHKCWQSNADSPMLTVQCWQSSADSQVLTVQCWQSNADSKMLKVKSPTWRLARCHLECDHCHTPYSHTAIHYTAIHYTTIQCHLECDYCLRTMEAADGSYRGATGRQLTLRNILPGSVIATNKSAFVQIWKIQLLWNLAPGGQVIVGDFILTFD